MQARLEAGLKGLFAPVTPEARHLGNSPILLSLHWRKISGFSTADGWIADNYATNDDLSTKSGICIHDIPEAAWPEARQRP